MKSDLVIAICTLNRPEGLRSVLAEILSQKRDGEAQIKILVIDNSANRSAAWVTTTREFQKRVCYLHVPEGGLSRARNAALEFGREAQAAVAFLDDDEIPGIYWLETAKTLPLSTSTEIYVGPVYPDFGTGAGPHKISRQFWERPRRQDGEIVQGLVGDGNIIYPMKLISSGLTYSELFSFTGGQDTDFLLKAKELGFSIRNLQNLSVTERVPLERQTKEYLIARSFHSSSSWVIVSLSNGGNKIRILLSILKKTIFCCMYYFTSLITRSLNQRVKTLIHAASVRGSVAALRGKPVNRYQNYQGE